MSSKAAERGGYSASLDGAGLRAMVEASARALDCNQAEINVLNVFPVPDGDTGTNMCLTLAAVMVGASDVPEDSAGAMAAAMEHAALLGARGNSGLILAQYFTGLSRALHGSERIGGPEFAAALKAASAAAYEAVQDPVEGTMLTVLRCAAEAAAQASAASTSLCDVMAAAAESARDTVAKTPGMLDVLAQAGVVDSGAHGLSVMFAGALSSLRGESSGAITLPAPAVAGMENGAALREFLEAATETIFGYCTGFVIEGADLDIAEIRIRVKSMGNSSVVAGDERSVKVHLHPPNPGPVLTYAAELGGLSNISILNMDEQTQKRAAAATRPEATTRHQVEVVAVAAGKGMRRIFTESGMGASRVVAGADGMNPSVGELLAAVESAGADQVVILPNSRNVVGTANQVDGLSRKSVTVIPSTSMQHGVAALLAFSPDQDLDANVRSMSEALQQVVVAAVTVATRDFLLDDRAVGAGAAIGLLEGEIVAAGDSPEEVATELLSHRAIGGDLVTIYHGAGASPEEAARVASASEQARPDREVEIVEGGQPDYPYLISIE